MGIFDILIILLVIFAVLGGVLYFLNRWASKRMVQQQDTIEKNRTTTSIYVIDKKKEKMQNANFPKAALAQMPRWSKIMKMPLVKAKIGPQILTLVADKRVFEMLPVKKTVKVDLAGMYIVHMKGMKSKYEMAEIRKARRGSRLPFFRKKNKEA